MFIFIFFYYLEIGNSVEIVELISILSNTDADLDF